MKNELNFNHIHPFMAVRREQFADLQKKAEQSPWKEMKQDARKRLYELQFNPDDCFILRCNSVCDIADAAALLYILEPPLRKQCVQKLLDIIRFWQPEVPGNLYDEMYHSAGDHWIGAIPPGAAFVNCLLALDIIYDDLTKEQRLFCEQTLETIAENYIQNDENHMVAILGVRGLWALYQGQKEQLFQAWESWKELFMGYITEDGAGVMSIDYSVDRFVRGNRVSKIILPIVMDFTGLDKSFYQNQKVIHFTEWALGYTYTPAKNMWLIGDTLLTTGVKEAESLFLVYGAAKYSKKAAEFAAWLMKDRPPRGKLLNYLLLKEDFKKPRAPKSQILKDGGAWFYEDIENKDSLAGVLWNSTIFDGHGHKEINSVNIAAYGRRLYVNAGYSGWGSGAEGFTWNYINQRALSANTVLVDYDYHTVFDPEEKNDHQLKSGAGIVEGFSSEKLCYALGDSGSALPNAVHRRGFVMVAGENDASGYVLLLDSVDAGNKMTVVHRPFSDAYKIEKKDTEYVWKVENAGLSVFLATPPSDTEMIDGIVADRISILNKNFQQQHIGFKIKSLLASYSAGTMAATVLFPFDERHKKPILQRTKAGAKLIYSHQQDLLLTTNCGDGETRFNGAAAIVRRTGSGCKWFFAQHATDFNCMGSGFHSTCPVSVFFDGTAGMYTAQADTEFTLFVNSGERVLIGAKQSKVLEKDSGKISFLLPAGTNSIRIVK